MRDWTDNRERRLIALVVAMLAVVVAGELYHHLSLRPVAPSGLLLELIEVVFLVGCTVTCTLLILRVRVWVMAAATAVILAVLLAEEVYLGVTPVTPSMLLFELLEAALLVGGSIACALLIGRRISCSARLLASAPIGRGGAACARRVSGTNERTGAGFS